MEWICIAAIKTTALFPVGGTDSDGLGGGLVAEEAPTARAYVVAIAAIYGMAGLSIPTPVPTGEWDALGLLSLPPKFANSPCSRMAAAR